MKGFSLDLIFTSNLACQLGRSVHLQILGCHPISNVLVILKREPASGAGATKDGVDRRTSRCKNDVLPAVQQSAEVRTLRESTANNMTLDNAAARSTPNKAGKSCAAVVVASSGLPSSGVQVSGSRREIGDCFSLPRTRRHVGAAITVQTSEECPHNGSAIESVSTILQDVKPEDRPIVGSVGSHWEAPARTNHLHIWDGKGIPNSTYKYREVSKQSPNICCKKSCILGYHLC